MRDLEFPLRETIYIYLHVGVLAERDLVVFEQDLMALALMMAPSWFLV